jgi:predicted transposase/invertase (TIGR01784 family)
MMLLKEAEQKLGEEKGKAECMKLGDGKAEGRAEGKIAVAKNLLKTGISIEVIVKSTDLTADEIKRLIED